MPTSPEVLTGSAAILAAVKGGLTLALIGLGIVFVVQSLTTVAVTLMRQLDARWQADESVAAQTTASAEEATIDHTTLVLLTAAVTTVLQGRAFTLRRIRRVRPRAAAQAGWLAEGRAVLHGSHAVRRGGR